MSIEKEFVLYQEALALKELGFDEPCFGKWLSSLQSNWKEYELILEMGMNEDFEDNRNSYLLEGACSAPTFSQAFRWFRENHNLHHEIEYNGYEYLGYVSGMTANIFKTFEEAELKCLKRLIKILQGGNK